MLSPGAPVAARDLLVGCVAENSPKYLTQALRLVQSIRWFGGELAKARLLVCAVEAIADAPRRELESYGAEVRVVRRFDDKNPSANRLRFFEEAWEEDREALLVLDCDTLVVRDPLPLLRRGLLQAKTESMPTVTHDVFERLFDHFGLPLPLQSRLMGWTRTPTIPYFNAGVLYIPSALARQLVPVWGRFNRQLADRPELAYPCERHLHQASLALALAACPVPFEELPVELNYQLNATHLTPPEGFLAVDPAILHYHDLADAEGLPYPSPYPLARMRIERFNQRLRAEGKESGCVVAARSTAPVERGPGPSPQVVVLGMHRSGAAAVAGLLDAMLPAAEPGDGPPPVATASRDDVVIFHDALLAALGSTWSDPDVLDGLDDLDSGPGSGPGSGRLAEPVAAALEERARELIASFDRQGRFIVEDPRLCLLLPYWRRLLTRPVCVLVHRDPLAIARSLRDRDGLDVPLGIALWELHARAALAGSLGLPRVLVCADDLLADPAATLQRVRQDLGRLGVGDLRQPEETAIRSLLAPALEDHPSGDSGEPGDPRGDPARRSAYLNAAQLGLLAALESAAALGLDPVPPLSAGARDTLAAHRRACAERRALRSEVDYRDGVIAGLEVRDVLQSREASELTELAARGREELRQAEARAAELDHLLAAVFASRSWRAGHAASRFLRRLFRPASPPAPQRWKRLRAQDRR